MGILEFLHRFDKGQDEELDKWFLVSSSVPILTILIVYLVFILKVGPMLMKNLQPYRLKNILLLYNLFQIVYNTYMFVKIMQVSRVKDTLMDPECRIDRTREQQLEFFAISWHYFMAKVTDLLDTIFFVLRKKYNQITFLHVYHHSMMVLMGWFCVKYILEEQLLIVGYLNTFVHILMYTYYLVSAMGPQFQKYLWWKKYITTIQLVQFVIITVYMLIIVFKGCQMSIFMTVFSATQGTLFFYLFFKFYRSTYEAKNNSNKVK